MHTYCSSITVTNLANNGRPLCFNGRVAVDVVPATIKTNYAS